MYTHGHIIQGLQISFKLDFSPITITQTLPNWDSIIIHSKPFSDVIHNKLCSGWYLGLFTKDELEHLISPFPSSPFSIIPKATIGKCHIQQNHSFPCPFHTNPTPCSLTHPLTLTLILVIFWLHGEPFQCSHLCFLTYHCIPNLLPEVYQRPIMQFCIGDLVQSPVTPYITLLVKVTPKLIAQGHAKDKWM